MILGVAENQSSSPEEDNQVGDSELIARAKTDKDAFGELYSRYVDRIYNYIYYRTNNVDDAQDLTARTFQRAMKHIPNYEDKGIPFSAWLYRIARNLVSNWHRDQGRRPVIALDDIVHWQEGDESPEKLMQRVESEETLLKAINQLPSDRQDLLIYKFLHRMSNAQIGNIMGRSEGAIKSLYHRTLIALREEINELKLPDSPDSAETEIGEEKSRRRTWRFWDRDGRQSEV